MTLLLIFMFDESKIIYDISATTDHTEDHSIYQFQSKSSCTATNDRQLSKINNNSIPMPSSPSCLILPTLILPTVGEELQNIIGQKQSQLINSSTSSRESLDLLPNKNEGNDTLDARNTTSNLSSFINVKKEAKNDKLIESFDKESLAPKGSTSNIIKRAFGNDSFSFLTQQIIDNEISPKKGNELAEANSKYQFQSGTVCSDKNDQVPISFDGQPIPSSPPAKCWIPPDTDKVLHDLEGGPGLDLIYGKDGLDVIYGKDGNDILDGGNQDDIIFGDNGNDKLVGSLGDDWLVGGGGEDKAIGSFGNDYLLGGNGKDELSGGAGTDVLKGGKESDFFVCGTDEDIVLDFNIREGDIIDKTCENVENNS